MIVDHIHNVKSLCVTQYLSHCGGTINPTWSTDSVLDTAPSLYPNPYLRHHDFYLFRYLICLGLYVKFQILPNLPYHVSLLRLGWLQPLELNVELWNFSSDWQRLGRIVFNYDTIW